MRYNGDGDEAQIPLTEVPNLLPKRRGKRVHYSTVYRWVSKGVRGERLESQLVGGVRYTTIRALRRFCDTVQPAATQHHLQDALRRHLYGEET